jgi:hypothetical protein
MNKVDKAIAVLELRNRVESYVYGKVAETNGCSCSAVSQRWRGVSRPRADSVADSLALLLPQGRELIEYITKLHFEGLAPTRKMVRNFGMEMAGRELSKR